MQGFRTPVVVFLAICCGFALPCSTALAFTCSDLNGASVFSQESRSVYLGFFGNPYATDSIDNPYGPYGSQYQSLSVRNPYGPYGSEFQSLSATNPYTVTPPIIVSHNNAIAYLTTNTTLAPRISLATIDGTCGTNLFTATAPDVVGGYAGPDLNQRGLSGTWYNPQTSGQGFVMEVAPDFYGSGKGALFAGWYTYDTSAAGGQRWYTLQGQVSSGSPTATIPIYFSHGGAFDVGGTVSTEVVGQTTLSLSDCNHAVLKYVFSDGSGRSGTVPLTRLLTNPTCH